MSYNVYMIYPELNIGYAPGDLLAQGMVRAVEIKVGQADSEHEARCLALNLGIANLKDRKARRNRNEDDTSTVIGFGIRSRYTPPKTSRRQHEKTYQWEISMQDIEIMIYNEVQRRKREGIPLEGTKGKK